VIERREYVLGASDIDVACVQYVQRRIQVPDWGSPGIITRPDGTRVVVFTHSVTDADTKDQT
jgi:hypothetical protein